jgi:hypothetical protein
VRYAQVRLFLNGFRFPPSELSTVMNPMTSICATRGYAPRHATFVNAFATNLTSTGLQLARIIHAGQYLFRLKELSS